MRGLGRWLAAFHLLVASAGAHQASDSLLELEARDDRLSVRWWVALKDLEAEVGLDGNGDGAITWGELAAREGELAGRMREWVRLSAGAAAWVGEAVPLAVDEREDGAYAVLGLDGARPGEGERLGLEYQFLFATDPGHRVQVRFRQEGGEATALLEPGSRSAAWTVQGRGELARLGAAAWAAPGAAARGGAGVVLGLAVPWAGARGGGRPLAAALALSAGFWLGVLLASGGWLAARPEAEAWALGLAALGAAAEAVRPRLGPAAGLRLAAGAGVVWGIAAGPGVAAAAGTGLVGWAGAVLGVEACLLLGALSALLRSVDRQGA